MSSETNWTKQDWLIDGLTVYALNTEGTNRFNARIEGGWATHGRNRTQFDELTANARLIAAAPELYEALRAMVEAAELEDWDGRSKDYAVAVEVLAKARGEA